MTKLHTVFQLFLLCFFLQNSFAQFGNDVSYLFRDNGEYKYLVGTSEPDSNWNKPDFVDTTWLIGRKSIGYGDGDDSTLVDTCISLYIRIKFSMDQFYQYLNFMADFDDGYVAYLNGVEIARSNLGKPGESIPYNRLADRSHEAQVYRNFFRPVNGRYIDNSVIAAAGVFGENILAIQVHNDSINGSDLSFNSSLLFFSNLNEYFIYQDYLRFIRQVPLDSTRFPIISIQTDEYGIASSSAKYIAHMSIINQPEGMFNKPADNPTDYNGRISIELRGKTSLHWPKKSYNIETQNSLGENLNVSLLGMPPENDWVLSGPFGDKSLFRNALAYRLGEKLGYYEPRTRFCELIINGEFLGLYVLTEKIKRDSARVDIAKLRPEDISGTELTGGYIVKYDKDASGLIPVYPRSSVIVPIQWTYINGFFNDFYAVLDKPEFLDEVSGYKNYINDQSLIDYVIINEAFRNCDAYLFSTYMHKDKITRDGRINYGPLWDFDFSLGNVTWQNAQYTNGWQFEINTRLGITKVMRDTSFARKFKERWNSLRLGILSNDSLNNFIDSLANEIQDARIRNYNVWPIIQYPLTNNDHVTNYDLEIQSMKNFMVSRVSWIDFALRSLYYPLPHYSFNDENYSLNEFMQVYPNPFNDFLVVDFKKPDVNVFTIELVDIFGRKTGIVHHFNAGLDSSTSGYRLDGLANLPQGMYILVLSKNGEPVSKVKLIKK